MVGSAENDLGIIGFGTMGKNLALNFVSKNKKIAAFDNSKDFETVYGNFHNNISIFSNLLSFATSLKNPKIVILLIPAGKVIDDVILQLQPILPPDSYILDFGNSFYEDSIRRNTVLLTKNINYFDVGISGGAEGAKNGPAMMVGGDKYKWLNIKSIFELISIKNQYNEYSIGLVGPSGAGHFVKMIHNGIEYALMESIAECYFILKQANNSNLDIANFFDNTEDSHIHSYLIDISAKILRFKDPESDSFLIDKILDKAQHKGTGKWTSIEALKLGVSTPVLYTALSQRLISSKKDLRIKLSSKLGTPQNVIENSDLEANLLNSIFFIQFLAFYEGLSIISAKFDEFKWNVNYQSILQIWSKGTIIESNMIKELYRYFGESRTPDHLLVEYYSSLDNKYFQSMKSLILKLTELQVPGPIFYVAYSSYISRISRLLPMNLIQAQRDYFGAHGFFRDDRPDFIQGTKWNK